MNNPYEIRYKFQTFTVHDPNKPESGGLRLGQVVSYGDMANARQKAVVVETQGGPHGQKVVFVEDYHVSTVSKTYLESPGGWQYEKNPDFSAEECSWLVKRSEEAVIEREEKRKQAVIDFAAQVQKLKAEHPELIPTGGKTGGCVLAAKNIRIELKKAFPSVKFSVRTERFSGGNSIDIRWTDGPTTKEVDVITDKYEAGYFDGMTDSYNYRDSAWTEAFGAGKYVNTSRKFSPALVAGVIEKLKEKYGDFNTPTVEDYENGRAYNVTPIGGEANMSYHSWQSLITREASDTAA